MLLHNTLEFTPEFEADRKDTCFELPALVILLLPTAGGEISVLIMDATDLNDKE